MVTSSSKIASDFFVCFWTTPCVAHCYSWLYKQKSFLIGSGDHLGRGGSTLIGHVQGKHPIRCAIATATQVKFLLNLQFPITEDYNVAYICFLFVCFWVSVFVFDHRGCKRANLGLHGSRQTPNPRCPTLALMLHILK